MVSKHFKSPNSVRAVLLRCLALQSKLYAGPEAEQCQKLIEAHKACLRKEGFNV